MPVIWSLRPNVSREQAIADFRGHGPLHTIARLVRGPLDSVAELYLPFGLFRVHIDSGGRSETAVFAIDLVRGEFDLYQFQDEPEPDALVQLESRNVPAVALDAAAAQERIVSRVRRLIFNRGFFRIRTLDIRAEMARFDLHVPYWIGVWRKGEAANIAVMDAVRRRLEGAKLRNYVREWLRSGGQ